MAMIGSSSMIITSVATWLTIDREASSSKAPVSVWFLESMMPISCARVLPLFAARGALVSLFVDPDSSQIDIAAQLGAPFIELHTGSYANANGIARAGELERLALAARRAQSKGLRVNAGHGLNLANTRDVAKIAGLEELNIGHSIVARSLFVGVEAAVREMLNCMGRST